MKLVKFAITILCCFSLSGANIDEEIIKNMEFLIVIKILDNDVVWDEAEIIEKSDVQDKSKEERQ